MFAVLQKYKNQEFYEEHPVWYFLTLNGDYKIELIGGYTTPSNDEITYGIPDTTEEREALIEKAKSLSTFNTETEIYEDERLITLSTCDYKYDGQDMSWLVYCGN